LLLPLTTINHRQRYQQSDLINKEKNPPTPLLTIVKMLRANWNQWQLAAGKTEFYTCKIERAKNITAAIKKL